METEKSITLENLVAPYSEEGFSEQLLSCGIPEASIEEIRSTYTGDDPTDNLLSRLYADIERSETRIIDGERHLQFTGAFVTDGKSVLLERHPDFGKKGYGMGGLFAYSGITPEENMLKEIDEETPIAPVNSRLRLLSETAESSISPRLPDVMSHRTGHFFIYFAGVNGLDDMPEIYQGSDGDPHELYVVKIEDIADDPNIAKGWKGDAIKHILDNPKFLSEQAIRQIAYFSQNNHPCRGLGEPEASIERRAEWADQSYTIGKARAQVHQIINSDSISDDDAVTELKSIIDKFMIPRDYDKESVYRYPRAALISSKILDEEE